MGRLEAQQAPPAQLILLGDQSQVSSPLINPIVTTAKKTLIKSFIEPPKSLIVT